MRCIFILFAVTLSFNSFAQEPPNDKTVIRISCGRASITKENAPLWVIDGKVAASDASQIKGLNPNDIDKISVLKGAKAIAQYGEKAKNGVIIICMKPKLIL